MMNWVQNKSSGQRDIVVVGAYILEQEQILIDKYIQWYNSISNTVSVLQLSRYIRLHTLKNKNTYFM